MSRAPEAGLEQSRLKRVTPSMMALAALMQVSSTGCRRMAGEALANYAEQKIDEHGTPRSIEGTGGAVDHFLHPARTNMEADPQMLLSFHVITAPPVEHPSALRVRVGEEIQRQTGNYHGQAVNVVDGALNTRSLITSRDQMLAVGQLGEGTHLDLASRIDDLDAGSMSSTDTHNAYVRSIWLNVRQLEATSRPALGPSRSAEGHGDTYERAVGEALSNVRNQSSAFNPAAGHRLRPNMTPPAPGARWDNIGRLTGADEGSIYTITSLPGAVGVQHREIVLEGIDGVERSDQAQHPASGVTVRLYYHDVAMAQ